MSAMAAMLLVLLPISRGNEIRWFFDLGRASQEARVRQVPILLDLHPDAPSRSTFWLDHFVFRDARVQEATQHCIPLRLTFGGSGKELAAKLGVERPPAILFLTPSGTPYWMAPSRTSAEVFVRSIGRARQLLPNAERYVRQVNADPASIENPAGVAVAAWVHGQADQAFRLLELAHQKNPRSLLKDEATLLVAEGLRGKRLFDRAALAYERASMTNDVTVACQALMGLSFCLLQSDRQDEALKAVKRMSRFGEQGKEYQWIAMRSFARFQRAPVAMAPTPAATGTDL